MVVKTKNSQAEERGKMAFQGVKNWEKTDVVEGAPAHDRGL